MQEQRDSRIVPGPLRLTASGDGDGVVRLAVDGEIDMSNSDALTRALTAIIADPGVRRLVVDLADVRFMASSGISALVSAQREAVERDVRLVVEHCQPMIERVLAITGVDKLLFDNS